MTQWYNAAQFACGLRDRIPYRQQAAPVVEEGDLRMAVPLSARRRVSHYEIERLIGAGGMAEVYLARDLALGRQAALKLLGPSADPSLRERLLGEADLSARLQHPGIATFYDSGIDGDTAFIAMEFVEGDTLRARLTNCGAFEPRAAVALTASLLEALGHAHAAGLFHRDIKPENIIIRPDGTPKLLDFGLARSAAVGNADETVARLSAAGAVLGTVGYMAPEQLRGEPVDYRVDFFAMGAVLHELLTARPAIGGHSTAERVAATLAWQADSVAVELPLPSLRDVLRRALAAHPSVRYESAAAFLRDLHRASESPLQAMLPNTLAVVDFENLSRVADDDWLGSGIAETLTADLARLPSLTIVGRERVARAQVAWTGERRADALDIALKLACRFVLTGSFQKAGRAVRITSRLSEVATGRVLSTEKVDGTIDDIFAMQDRLSAGVAHALDLAFPSRTAGAPPRVSAFECYARGQRELMRLGQGSFDRAHELFEEACAIDAHYALPLAGLAGISGMRFNYTADRSDLEQAEAFARRAIELEPGLAEAHVWLGYALWREGRATEALEAEQVASELDPQSFFPPYFSGVILESLGRFHEGTPHLQRAVSLDNEVGANWFVLGMNHLSCDGLKEAAWCFRQAKRFELTKSRSFVGSAMGLAETFRRQGDLAAARGECLEALQRIEGSDHIYRDSMRAASLICLARCATLQHDQEAAEVAYQQTIAHLRGRPHSTGGGHLLAQAQAGLAAALRDVRLVHEAENFYRQRTGMDFSWAPLATDGETRLALALAAAAVDETERAEAWVAEARVAGCSQWRLREVLSHLEGGGA